MRCRTSSSPSLRERRQRGQAHIPHGHGGGWQSSVLPPAPAWGWSPSPQRRVVPQGLCRMVSPQPQAPRWVGADNPQHSQPTRGLWMGRESQGGETVPGWLLAWVPQLCAYLDLMLKFFPREMCLMDLLLPMESTSVTMSESKPGERWETPTGMLQAVCRGGTEVAPHGRPAEPPSYHHGMVERCPGQLLSIFLLFVAPPRRSETCAELRSPRSHPRGAAPTI